MIRPEVQNFVSLGRLPSERGEPTAALEEAVNRAEATLNIIGRPVSDEEAQALAECFGDDLCFGLAWTLLHTIETAPSAAVDPPDGVRRWQDTIDSL